MYKHIFLPDVRVKITWCHIKLETALMVVGVEPITTAVTLSHSKLVSASEIQITIPGKTEEHKSYLHVRQTKHKNVSDALGNTLLQLCHASSTPKKTVLDHP